MKLATAVEAAEGIIRIALEKVHGSLRSVSVEKGKDPRDYNLVSFGGAGGLVACELAKICGVAYPLIIPPSPGGMSCSIPSFMEGLTLLVLCALGEAYTGIRHEISTTMIHKLKDMNVSDFQGACDNLKTRVSSVLLEQQIMDFAIGFEVDLRFHGQATNLPVSFEQQEVVDHGFIILEDRRVFLTAVEINTHATY